MPLNVVLVEPEIPPNTGNIIRLCANTGARLHLVRPLGFELDHSRMRRAGLDYHELTDIQVHESWESFGAFAGSAGRRYAITTKGHRSAFDVNFASEDFLLFGSETRGLSPDQRNSIAPQDRLRIPMQPENRSLNLSNAVAVVVYEAWRQQRFDGAAPPATTS
jgi:tRNA (cytidine/uridine-2'-O-)-methyltransferase